MASINTNKPKITASLNKKLDIVAPVRHTDLLGLDYEHSGHTGFTSKRQFDDQNAAVDEKFTRVAQQFTGVDNRFTALDDQLNEHFNEFNDHVIQLNDQLTQANAYTSRVESQVEQTNQNISRIETNTNTQINQLETQLTSASSQIQSLASTKASKDLTDLAEVPADAPKTDVYVFANFNQQPYKVSVKDIKGEPPKSCLPEVSTADQGKFLRVDAAGNWVADTIPYAENSEGF